MRKPLILLDFDGVLFNSAYEAYQVCEHMANRDTRYRHGLSFDDFMSFRSHLTDAWQFCRLYNKERILRDITQLKELVPDKFDWEFAGAFFETRAEMMKAPDWPKLMSPYPFFYQLRPLIMKYPKSFKILSTRNKESIRRTLEFYESSGIEIFGQESIRECGSKLLVAKQMKLLDCDDYVIYIDDMNSHLEPFEAEVDLCIQAGWGYDVVQIDSFTQRQAFRIINAFFTMAYSN